MLISDAFHLMAKPAGPICNLNCKYCYYLEKEKLYHPKTNLAMPDGVLEKFIKDYIKIQNAPVVTFAWQGGEPTLLGVDFFKKAVALQEKYADEKKIENTLQTNGILLNDQWCEFLSENKFLIGLSIDGPREIHDKYRVHKSGQSSFDAVMNGLNYLKKNNVEFNTLTCVQKDNSYKPLDVYNFLKDIGSRYMQFIPIVERKALHAKNNELELVLPSYKNEAVITDWSVEPLQYGKFMMAIFDEWVKQDVGSYFVQLFDVCLGIWCGQEASLCVFKETCGQALALEHNGDVYSCDHYVYTEHKLQNIMEKPLKNIVDSEKQIQFGLDKKIKLPNYCLKCDVRFACNGECPKNRFMKTPEGEDGLNYLCDGYKYFFHNIDPYMKFMANELSNKRPPANVIGWVKSHSRPAKAG